MSVAQYIAEIKEEMPISKIQSHIRYYTKYVHEYKLYQKPDNHPNLNEKKFLDKLISYKIESLKVLEAMPNIDNDFPQDFLDELKKMHVGELNLTRQRYIIEESSSLPIDNNR